MLDLSTIKATPGELVAFAVVAGIWLGLGVVLFIGWLDRGGR